MNTDDLKQIDLFSNLSKEELSLLATIFHKQEYKAAEKIYSTGEPSENFFLVENGKIIIFHKLDGDTITVGRLGKGYFFGESGILTNNNTHKTDAMAEVDNTSILKLTKNNFEKLKKENPELALKIIEKISAILSDRLTEDIAKIAIISAIDDIINKPNNLDNIYNLANEILNITIKAIPAHQAFLGIYKKHDEEKISILSSIGLSPKHLPKEMPIDSDIYIKKITTENKEIRIPADEYEKSEKVFYAKKNILARPISIENEIIGVIVLSDKQKGDFTINNGLMLSVISGQISFAIEEARLRKEKVAQEELKRTYVGL
jgi:CRP/FNR family transcriptional regulator, cyclic AMP receptor protein